MSSLCADSTEFIKKVGAALAAIFTYALGGADSWLVGLAIMMLLDLISGVLAAIVKQELSSKKCARGFVKKMLMLCAVGVAHLVDQATGAGGVLRALSIGYLMANEGISVLENCGRCGIKLPKKLVSVLEQLQDAGSEKEE